jgi:hypothetical protein
MRHSKLCAAFDVARAATKRRDFIAADRARNIAYGIDDPLSWFIAGEIELMIVAARAEANRPTAESLRRFA